MSIDNATWLGSEQTQKLLKFLENKLSGYTLEQATVENLEALKTTKQEILGVRSLVLSFAQEYKGKT